MSVFAIAGTSLALVRTRLFKVEPVYDSSVNVLWNKFTISCSGLLAATPTAATLPYNDAAIGNAAATAAELAVSIGADAIIAQAAAAAAQTAAVQAAQANRKRGIYTPGHVEPSNDPTQLLNDLKHKFMLPRQPFFYRCGNLVVQCPGGLDANCGPKPLSCEVRNMNNGYFMVDFAIELCLADCPDNTLPSPVVSVVWVQRESFDENWNSTITTNGKLTTRSDMRTTGDSFRNLCVPGMLTDYRRTHIDWTPNESGTQLGFTITDREEQVMPPYGATTARGRFTVVLAGGGAKRTGQCDVTLTCPKGGSRADLMAIATRMCMAKLQSEGILANIYNGSFSEELFTNSVTVSLQGLLQSIRKNIDRGAVRTPGYTPFVQQGQLPLAPPVRSRLIALLSPPFFTPCTSSPGTAPFPSTTPSTSTTTTNSDGSTTTTVTPGVPAPGTQLVSGGSIGMIPSPSVLASSVASSTPVGPTAFASTRTAPEITITVVESVPDPAVQDAIDFTDTAPYESYTIECEYSFDSGKVMLPGTGVGADGSKAIAVQRHGGIMFLDVNWYVERRTIAPVIPRFKTPNSNFVALDGIIRPQEIQMSADLSSPIYCIGGFYRYGVIDPDNVSVVSAVPPFLSDAAGQAAKQTAGWYSDDILWKFQGSGGPSPFTSTVVGQKPGDAVAKALGAGLAVLGIPVPPAFAEPPPFTPPPPAPPE